MPEREPGLEPQDLIAECLASDGLVVYLAEDILDGELEMDLAHPFLTDQIDFQETCQDIREKYGVSQSQVEQAIEHAKSNIMSRAND
jgi:hypothetical protein